MVLTAKRITHVTHTVNGEVLEFTIKGQTAETLLALIDAGKGGLTTQDVPRGFRLAAYVHILRRRHGVNIRSYRVKTTSAWHGRYVLGAGVWINAVEWDA